MKKIYKRALQLTSRQDYLFPSGTEILSAQVQYDVICVWYLFDTEEKEEEERITFLIYGTGHPMDSAEEAACPHYLATVQLGAGVWHIFTDGRVRAKGN